MIPENITKENILTNKTKQQIFNNLMSGLNLEETAKKVNKSYEHVRRLATKGYINQLVKKENARIAEKLEINVSYCQKRFIELADQAQAVGKQGVARACIADLCKTIGGFQTDAINPANKASQTLPEALKHKILADIQDHYKTKYLASDEVTVVDITSDDGQEGTQDASESTILDDKADNG